MGSTISLIQTVNVESSRKVPIANQRPSGDNAIEMAILFRVILIIGSEEMISELVVVRGSEGDAVGVSVTEGAGDESVRVFVSTTGDEITGDWHELQNMLRAIRRSIK